MTHARLSPSSAARWRACPGSARIIDATPPEAPKAYTQHGTYLHGIAADLLLNKYPVASPEDTLAVAPYVEYCRGLRGEHHVEKRVELSAWGLPQVHGTADFIAFGSGTIEVVDLKTGKGVGVKAHGNAQLALYAAGAVDYVGRLHVRSVRMTIVQPPRSPLPQTWAITLDELATVVRELRDAAALVAEADAAEDVTPYLKAGAHCYSTFCPARTAGTCPASGSVARKKMIELLTDLPTTTETE